MTDEQHPALPLQRLFHAQTEVSRRRAMCEAASTQLALAHIKERQAELVSQDEPLHSRADELCRIVDPSIEEVRKLINDAIFYVIVGRWPK